MKAACDKCKSCTFATTWKSKGQIKAECYKGNNTTIGCKDFKPKSATVEPAKL